MATIALVLAPAAAAFSPLRAPLPLSTRAAIRMGPIPVDLEAGWKTTASGLQYLDEKPGGGEKPNEGDVVKVDYTGWLESDGKEFATSTGRKPIAFAVGKGRVIPGWDEGILSMSVGGKRRLSIPAELAYGENGAGDAIPPNSRLQFECELVGIESGFGAIASTFPGGLPNLVLVTLLALSFIPYFLPEKPPGYT